MRNYGIIFGIVGGVAGFIGGYFLGKRSAEKRCDEELAEMKAFYEKNVKEVAEELGALGDRRPAKAPDKPDLSTYKVLADKYSTKPSEVRSEAPEGQYEPSEEAEDEYLDEDGDEEEDEELIAGKNAALEYERTKNLPPKLITSEEFGSYEDFDQRTLLYYTGDGTLANEDDEIIDDPVAYIGGSLDKYGFRDSDETAIYVRNWRLQTDYEVIKVEGELV